MATTTLTDSEVNALNNAIGFVGFKVGLGDLLQSLLENKTANETRIAALETQTADFETRIAALESV